MKEPIQGDQGLYNQYFRDVRPADIKAIGRTFFLRNIDCIEAWGMYHLEPYIALRQTLNLAETSRAIDIPGIGLVGFCGITRIDEQQGAPWMVASDAFSEQSALVLKYSKWGIHELCRPFRHCFNFVAAQNVKSIRWLMWLGFTVDLEPLYFADPDVPFHLFWRINPCAS